MEWYQLDLNGDRSSQFPERSIPGYDEVLSKQISECDIAADYIGGIINRGRWGWMTRRNTDTATILICELTSGFRVANYTFLRESDRKVSQRCSIRCVQELFPNCSSSARILLAVCIELPHGRTQLAIYTPTNSQVLRYIELSAAGISVRSMAFLDDRLCRNTIMKQYDGCLILGTEAGSVLLMDANAIQVIANRAENVFLPDNEVQRSEILHVPIRDAATEERVNAKLMRARQLQMHVALDLEMPMTDRINVTSLLQLELISGFAAGLSDGRICIYDLRCFQLVAQLRLPPDQLTSSVVGLSCIVPPDDPQPCFYICSVYDQGDRLMASLHSLNYRRSALSSADGEFQLRDFQSASTRIRLALDNGSCSLISCGTYSVFALSGDYGTVLTAITWHSNTDQKNKLILFDINQWYKDELPSQPRINEKLNYLCGYVFTGQQQTGLCFQLDKRSLIPFISLQRHDEYFYPSSLSFDCYLMTISGYRHHEYVGVQRRFLNSLHAQKANLFLNPQQYQEEIRNLRLLPQFHEYNPHVEPSRRELYEIILAVALEQDRNWVLYNCASNCLDGSYLCNMLSPTKLTLSILTNWIVKRANQIKGRCTELCEGIFDYGGYALDERERKEFQQLNGQLSKLQSLQLFILRQGKPRLGHEMLEDLQSTERALTVLYEYQRMLYWLIERGLLPLGSDPEQQPLQLIRREYAERRVRMRQNNVKLYIDEQLHHSGFEAALQQHCQQDSFYPPHTMQSLMRLMLLPAPELNHKHELMLYLLHDLERLLPQEHNRCLYKDYANVFGVSEPLVKCARSFWFLDCGDYAQTIEVLYRSRMGNSNYTEWQTKLLIETLLAHNADQEAMRVVHLPPGFISSELKLQVLLANNNIPEAFNHARVYMDDEGRPLLEHFFRHCILNSKFTVLASLCLRQHEEQLIYRLLRQCKTRRTDCVQLILLLKRCKYIEAVSFMDEVAAERQSMGESIGDETSTILSAYRTTMAPVTQSIAGTYFRIRDKLNGQQLRNPSPEPFSCQLAKQNANGQLDNIFQSSALSAHWATRYPSEQPPSLNSHNMPFLRNAAQTVKEVPQLRRRVRPTPFQSVSKRLLDPSEEALQQPKRRRLLGEQFAEEVANFVSRTLQLEQQEQQQLLEKQQVPPLHNAHEVATLLQPPGYLLSGQPREEEQQQEEQQQQQPPDAILELRPTILKRRPSARAVRRSTQEVEERRCFNFMPPIPLAEVMQRRSDQEEEEEDTDEIIMEIEQETISPTPQQAHPEQQPEQQQQQHNDSDSESESEYLSPLASANASFVDPSQEQRAPPSGPQPRSSLLQASSGFGSFATVQIGNTGSLRLNEFVPPVCSSKMYEMPTTTTSSSSGSSSSSNQVKISERTTICVDADEPSAATSPTEWSMPASLAPPTARPHMLQLLDTTLGMSSYELTALEPVLATETATDYINLDNDEEEQEQMLMQLEVEPAQQQQQEQEEEQDQEEEQEHEEQEHEESSRSSNEEPSALTYNRLSPSYSISSELSDMSSSGVVSSMPDVRQDAPVYSIVVESTTSITTSRSPTSHTPTSFLPSDTNVSQNSQSPRAAHGAAGDGSSRSLYRANSLETVDDLDTTKGSLEEDDDVDEEDECVIALDGTEVRGYVARPEPVAASSSAELFAFKQQQDECVPAVNPPPCASLGATANSDSVMAYTINLDSVDSADQLRDVAEEEATAAAAAPSDAATSNDSVATVAFSETKQPAIHEMEPVASEEPINLDSDVESNPNLTLALSEEEQEQEEQVQPEAATRSVLESAGSSQKTMRPKRSRLSSTGTLPVPERSIRLRSDDQRGRRLRRRSSSLASDELNTPDSAAPAGNAVDTPPALLLRRRLRSNDSANSSSGSSTRRIVRGRSLPPISTVPVSTPKRRKRIMAMPMEAIQEGAETTPVLPRTRSRTPLSQLGSSPAIGGQLESGTQQGQGQRKLRSSSEPPVTNAIATAPTRTMRTRKSSASDEQRQDATQPAAETPPPQTRNLRSRRNTPDTAAEQEAAPAPSTDAAATPEASVPLKKRGRAKK